MIQPQEHTFSMEDQERFAAFCGDRNPMHMDVVHARRTQAGAPVVHGMQILLWAMETLLSSEIRQQKVGSIRARFHAPLLAGDRTSILWRQKNPHVLIAKVLVADAPRSTIEFHDGFQLDRPLEAATGPVREIGNAPLELEFGDAAGFAGRVTPAPATQNLFPLTTAAIGADRVAAIGFASTLIGMLCPGLYSVLSSVTVDLEGPRTPWVDFNVIDTDDRFQRIVHDVSGAGIHARIEAFFRPRPVPQHSMRELSALVGKGEFAGSRVLVVGGSRGLGALTAKLLGCGGARILLSYAVGAEEAQAVQQEIRDSGGSCDIMKFDVSSDDFVSPPAFGAPTQVYYFATPKIFLPKTRRFSRDRCDHFQAFYVDGFEKLLHALPRPEGSVVSVFNPSSVAVTEMTPDMAEYVMAKMASEILADYLNRDGAFRIVSHRLPRLLTDQTTTISPVKTADAAEIMLPLIRQVQAA